ITLILIDFSQVIAHRDPLVEHKAFASQLTYQIVNHNKILQNPALEVIHLIETLAQQKARSYFTANATETQHRNQKEHASHQNRQELF
ncbi:hypothetical protein VSS95_29125, partial [Pseudomonas syringae pv. tagetis]